MKDLVITDVSQFVLLFPSLLDETLRLYEDDKLFLAHKAVQKMRNSLAHHQAAVDAYTAEVQVGLKGIEMEMEKHSKRMQTIVKEANEVLQLIEELEDDQGWSLVSQHEDGNVQVFYRNENSTPVHSIKMQGIIDSPALNLMAVMNEHTLYDTWIPLLREVQLVKHISRYRKVIYLSAYLPWPISSRDAVSSLSLSASCSAQLMMWNVWYIHAIAALWLWSRQSRGRPGGHYDPISWRRGP